MKKILFLGIFLLFVGCSDKKSEDSNVTQNIEEVKDIKNIKVSSGQELTNDNILNQFTTYNVEGERILNLSPDGEETTTSKQIGAIISVKNQYEKLNLDILKKKLSHNFIVKCSACHDDYANGIIGPSLLSKTSDDVFKMITAYKTGTKKNVLMKELVQNMSEKEIKELAEEIAKFNKEVRRQNEYK
jgi:cytochrome c553